MMATWRDRDYFIVLIPALKNISIPILIPILA